MFRFSLTTNDVQAWLRTRKLVFLRTLGRLNSVCLNRYAKKRKFMLWVAKIQIALVPITRKIKFNVGPVVRMNLSKTLHLNISTLFPVNFPGYEIAWCLICLWCFYSVFRFSFFFALAFFAIAIVKQPHYKRTLLHLHPVSHPITLCYIWSAVMLIGLPAIAFSLFPILGISTIAISDSILAKDVTLACSKAYICFCTLISTHLLYFLVG